MCVADKGRELRPLNLRVVKSLTDAVASVAMHQRRWPACEISGATFLERPKPFVVAAGDSVATLATRQGIPICFAVVPAQSFCLLAWALSLVPGGHMEPPTVRVSVLALVWVLQSK